MRLDVEWDFLKDTEKDMTMGVALAATMAQSWARVSAARLDRI